MQYRAIRTILLTVVGATAALAQSGGFGGPSILSRGGGGVGTSRGQAFGVSVYGSLQGTYTYGFGAVPLTTGTPVVLQRGPGVMVDGGLLGYYQRQRHATSFSVRGLYADNKAGRSYRNHGINLELAHSQQLSRKVQAFLSVAAGKTNYSGQFLYRFTEEPVARTVNPGFEIFDNHLTQASFAAGLTYQWSRRLSFSAQGGAFGADRREKGLADTRGSSGTGSVQFAMTRKTSVGGSGSYDWFFFPGRFGESRAKSSQVFLNHTIGRRWSFGMRGGVFSVFTERLNTVQLDPIIAQISGQTTGLQIFRKTTVGWIGGANVTARFRDSSLALDYGRSLQAGNGVYLTSTSDLGSLTYTRSLRGGWNISGAGTYSKLAALTQNLGNGTYRTVGGSVSRRINSFMNVVASAGYFNTSVFAGNFTRDRFYTSAGIQFSPHDLPLLR